MITHETRDDRQREVGDWCLRAFGDEAHDVRQRALRLLEEAAEAFQAVGGQRELAERLIDYVFGRPPGELVQELGGVGVTLLALANAAGLSAETAEVAEVQRILALPEAHFTARNELKNAAGLYVKGEHR